MNVELLNIPGRPASPYYSHVAVSSGTRTIHVAGQVGTAADGQVVDGGLAAQAEHALRNVGLAIEAAGAAPSDLVKLTVYVVDWSPAKFADLGAGLAAAQQALGLSAVPVTLIGVSALFEPDHLVEIEAVATAA